jgi:hypothetical protein
VAANDAFDKTFVREAVHAFGFFVTDAQGVHDGEVAGLLGAQKTFLHRFKQMGGFHQAAATAHEAHGVTVLDELCRLCCGHEFG